MSNKFCPAGTVDVYDCSPGTGFSPSLKRQIAVVLKCKYSDFTVRLLMSRNKLEMQTVVFFPSLLRMPFVVI